MVSKHKKPIEHAAVAKLLIVLAVVLAVLHIAAIVTQQLEPSSWLGSRAYMLDLDAERNIPTVYNGLLWGAAAFMGLLMTLRPQRIISRLRWSFLSALFFYFGFDEILVIHEQLAAPIRNALNISDGSIFYHAWIIPALVVAVGVSVLYKLTASKPRPSAEQKHILKLLIILAFGVIALEAAGTQVYFSQLVYKLGPVMVEELFEISMVSLILYKLTTYAVPERSK